MLRRKQRQATLRAAAVQADCDEAMLRRKQCIVLYCNRHPDEDYLPLHNKPAGDLTPTAWTAAHRENRSRQLVVVQEVKNDRLSELRSLAAISSPHVARLLALYQLGKSTFSVQELVDIDVLELPPLCEREIAGVFSQVQSPARTSCRDLQATPRLTGLGPARTSTASHARHRVSRRLRARQCRRCGQDW